MTEAPQILLAHHLKTLKLPTFLREYEKQARQCAAEGLDHVQFLTRLVELELIDRERRMVERRIKAAKFPAIKSLDSFDFKAIPKLNKMQVLELARCEWPYGDASIACRLTDRPARERHRPWAQWNRQDPHRPRPGSGCVPEGDACQLHHRRRAGQRADGGPRRTPPAPRPETDGRRQAVDHPLSGHCCAMPCRAGDELGFVPLSKTGAELLFEMISQRYERGATLITSNLPFDEWTETFGTERLTGALLDRLTHHVNILVL